MATENPNLPAPEEQVSDAAEDVQTVTSEATPEVPETEAPAAAEAESVAEAPAAEEPVAEPDAAPRAKRVRIKPVAEAVTTEPDEEAVPAGAEADFAYLQAGFAKGAVFRVLLLRRAQLPGHSPVRAAGECGCFVLSGVMVEARAFSDASLLMIPYKRRPRCRGGPQLDRECLWNPIP
mgnify:CR=1 FL=1